MAINSTNSSFSLFGLDNETSSPSRSPSDSTTPLSATLSDGYSNNSTPSTNDYEFGYGRNETTYGYTNESTYGYGGYDDTEGYGYGYDDYGKKDGETLKAYETMSNPTQYTRTGCMIFALKTESMSCCAFSTTVRFRQT